METASDIAGLQNALKISFDNWGKTSDKYGKLYKTLSKEALEIAFTALEEMPIPKPGVYDSWWAQAHPRWMAKIKQREMLLIHELMHNFLTDLCYGRLRQNEEPKAEKRKAKVKA